MSDLVSLLRPETRIVLAGGPRTGKSTTAVKAGERYGLPVRHGDSLIEEYRRRYGREAWSACSQEVSEWLEDPGGCIIEGVVAGRALRKWMKRCPGEPFKGLVVYFGEPIQVQTKEQAAMAKGCLTVWREIATQLAGRGARIMTPSKEDVLRPRVLG